MVGDFAVGKTSLTQKFIKNVFSDRYVSTIGVKIDSVIVDDTKLVIWDVAGRDPLSPINTNYLVGASGIVFVGDGTRPSTVKALSALWETVAERIGEVPVVVALNKHDHEDWSVGSDQISNFSNLGWDVFTTSAKEGENVKSLFECLVRKMSQK